MGVSFAHGSVLFLVAIGLAFKTTPFVMWGTTYATPESWLLTMLLNIGLLLLFSVSSKLIFQLTSPTYPELFVITFLFWGTVNFIVPDAEKSPAKRHHRELLIPALLGFACICLVPVVAYPGGHIPDMLPMGCLLACIVCSFLYAHVLQRMTNRKR